MTKSKLNIKSKLYLNSNPFDPFTLLYPYVEYPELYAHCGRTGHRGNIKIDTLNLYSFGKRVKYELLETCDQWLVREMFTYGFNIVNSKLARKLALRMWTACRKQNLTAQTNCQKAIKRACAIKKFKPEDIDFINYWLLKVIPNFFKDNN